MDASEIKVKLFRQIDAMDKENLEELYGIFLNFIRGKDSTDEWEQLTDMQKQGIERGIYELDDNQGIPQNIVLEDLRKKYGLT